MHTADGAEVFARKMLELIEREGGGCPIVHADAGFSGDRILRSLESDDIKHLMRLPSNSVLDRMARLHWSPWPREKTGVTTWSTRRSYVQGPDEWCW